MNQTDRETLLSAARLMRTAGYDSAANVAEKIAHTGPAIASRTPEGTVRDGFREYVQRMAEQRTQEEQEVVDSEMYASEDDWTGETCFAEAFDHAVRDARETMRRWGSATQTVEGQVTT